MQLDHLFQICVPKQTIFIAVDGPASIAKLLTQRKRRFEKSSNRRSSKSKFDGCQITPGVQFMDKLRNCLSYWACTRCAQFRYRNVKFYISPADVPSEGELKIFQAIFHLQQKRIHDPRFERETYLICGSDSDLIQLCMASQLKNVFVLSMNDLIGNNNDDDTNDNNDSNDSNQQRQQQQQYTNSSDVQQRQR
eukprot:GEZU01020338.1.p1 GENE.GEZU01020338.1~~GEZU01020338.1.p1  ORF type:complete len:193 (+),score=56.71 GEZU01020338.1:479-1057(+)